MQSLIQDQGGPARDYQMLAEFGWGQSLERLGRLR